jgi:hypothetical protein
MFGCLVPILKMKKENVQGMLSSYFLDARLWENVQRFPKDIRFPKHFVQPNS